MADGRALIERLRAADGTLDRRALLEILPYGDDFLFVDRVLSIEGRALEATFRVPDRAPYLDGHFRHQPIMPGALMSEAFAQAGSLLVRYHLRTDAEIDVLGHHVESARFLSPALPGDRLHLSVALRTLGRRAARLEGDVRVGDRQIGRMRVVVAILERAALLEEIEKLRGR